MQMKIEKILHFGTQPPAAHLIADEIPKQLLASLFDGNVHSSLSMDWHSRQWMNGRAFNAAWGPA